MNVPPQQPIPEDPDEHGHAGSEDDPPRELDSPDDAAVAPPVRYQSDQPGADEGNPHDRVVEQRAPKVPAAPPSTMDRLVAASVPISVIAFFLIGFTTGLWFVAWVVFLIPPVLRAWNRPHG